MARRNNTRREFVAAGVAAAAAVIPGNRTMVYGEKKMYGLISKVEAVPERREALISILVEGAANMPGCLSYIVAKDSTEPDAIWITEVWDTQDSHEASLSLPQVRDAIARGRPLIAGFSHRTVTEPVGGHGFD